MVFESKKRNMFKKENENFDPNKNSDTESSPEEDKFKVFVLRQSKINIKNYKKQQNSSSFPIILWVTMLLGIPMKPIEKKLKLSTSYSKTYAYVFFGLKLIAFLLSSFYASVLMPSFQLLVSFYIFNSACFLIYIDMLYRRREMYAATKLIKNLMNVLKPKEYIGSKTIKLEIVVSVVLVVKLMVIVFTFQFYMTWDHVSADIAIPFIEPKYTNVHFTTFVALCMIFTFATSFATCLISLILCYSVFLTLGKIINAYCLKLKKLVEADCDLETLVKSLKLFRKVFTAFNNVDDSFSGTVFFLFGTVFSNIFLGLSVVFSNNPLLMTLIPIFFVLIMFTGGVGVFFMITMSGANIIYCSETLKASLYHFSHEMARYSSDSSMHRLSILLSDNIRGSNFAVTGCKMFNIDRGLLLTVGGAVITYGFLLMNISRQEE